MPEMDKEHLRRLINMWDMRNVALTMSYLCIGVVETFVVTPITVYAVSSLNASPAMSNLLSTLMVGGHNMTSSFASPSS